MESYWREESSDGIEVLLGAETEYCFWYSDAAATAADLAVGQEIFVFGVETDEGIVALKNCDL